MKYKAGAKRRKTCTSELKFATNLDIITCSETQLPEPGERLEHVVYGSTAEKITEGHTTKIVKNAQREVKSHCIVYT